MTTVGSSPAARSTVATSDVVVVLPCEPATAMPYFMRISSASISARGMTGMPRARAAVDLGVRRLDRARDDDDVGRAEVLGVVAVRDAARRARRAGAWSPSPSGPSRRRRSRACAAPRRCRTCRCRRCRRSGCACPRLRNMRPYSTSTALGGERLDGVGDLDVRLRAAERARRLSPCARGAPPSSRSVRIVVGQLGRRRRRLRQQTRRHRRRRAPRVDRLVIVGGRRQRNRAPRAYR